MVDWGCGSRNRGYVKKWADTYLQQWDPTIERRAGGLDPTLAFGVQSLALNAEAPARDVLAIVPAVPPVG